LAANFVLGLLSISLAWLPGLTDVLLTFTPIEADILAKDRFTLNLNDLHVLTHMVPARDECYQVFYCGRGTLGYSQAAFYVSIAGNMSKEIQEERPNSLRTHSFTVSFSYLNMHSD
jgi:hypothetical protein